MAMVERSAHDAMRTHYCKFTTCSEAVPVFGSYCLRHQTPESRHELSVPGEDAMRHETDLDLREPDPVDFKCQFASCERRVRSRVGRYSYCQVHRSRQVREGLAEIESRNGARDGTVEPVTETRTRIIAGAAVDNTETHEGRLRKVLAAARALDKAELKMKAASEHLRRAKKAHRDALIEASAPHGVSHTE